MTPEQLFNACVRAEFKRFIVQDHFLVEAIGQAIGKIVADVRRETDSKIAALEAKITLLETALRPPPARRAKTITRPDVARARR
jgi:hypothetical protein